jgi:hypothetical protein
MKKDSNKEYHYTYYSYEEWGRGYFGSRSCDCLPEQDVKYLGSFRDKNFRPTQKIILKDDYLTRDEAIIDEIILHNFYEVDKNPHFANRAKQTSNKFTTIHMIGEKNHFYGKTHNEETRKKISLIHKGKTISEKTKLAVSKRHKGVPLSEEHKEKIKKSLTGLKRTEEQRKRLSEAKKGKPNTEKQKREHSIRMVGSGNPNYGVKTSPEKAEKIRKSNSKYTYKCISPSGEEYITYSMKQFCKEHNISKPMMLDVAHNKKEHFRGWKVEILSTKEE